MKVFVFWLKFNGSSFQKVEMEKINFDSHGKRVVSAYEKDVSWLFYFSVEVMFLSLNFLMP